MLLVYVAGPYDGRTADDVRRNVERACAVGHAVAMRGYAPIVPHAIGSMVDAAGDPGLGRGYWLDATMEMMRVCDAVMLVEGYEFSAGTAEEINEATKWGIPVVETVEELDAVASELAGS